LRIQDNEANPLDAYAPSHGRAGGAGKPRVVGDGGRYYPRLADKDLISLVAVGDAEAFGVLYERHCRAVLSLGRRLTHDEWEAEDLAQEAFLKVWRSANGYLTERGGVRKWIFSVARNAAIDRMRAQATRRRTLEKAEVPGPLPCEAFASAWRGSQRDRLRQALDTLPHAQRKVLALAHLQGLTHEEIAEFLCLPLGTVKGRMRLGLKKLRDHPGLREVTLA
jgi:RNA polymerase sigma-70 factor, ECF subfamily